MIIQLMADPGILAGGKKKIVVSVDPMKPLARAIPNILSKLKLTKKESIQLYFTTHSTSLEQGLGCGDWYDYSEATSSTGGLTISSEGTTSIIARVTKQHRNAQIQPLPISVDWNDNPVQMGLRTQGCVLWVKRSTKEQEPEIDSSCDGDDVRRVVDAVRKYNPQMPFEFLVPITNNGVAYSFVAKKDIPPGQVIWRERMESVEAYPLTLVEHISRNPMLSLNLPYDKSATTPSQSNEFSDEQWAKALSQATMNGVAVGDEMGFAPWSSVFNRGCWPNAMSFLSADRHTVDVVAIDAIQQGDELTLPWECIIDRFWMPPDHRNEWVQRKYSRKCDCGRCISPSSEDKGLTGAFYASSSKGANSKSNKLAVQVMREEHAAAIENSDRQQMVSFITKYTKDMKDDAVKVESLQLHPHHWRLAEVRSSLLQWYKAAGRKRVDKRLPLVLLDQIQMEESILPKYFPPRLKHYRQWRDLLAQQSQQVTALLKRMAKERNIDWNALSQLDLLEQYWRDACAAEVNIISTITADNPLPENIEQEWVPVREKK
eukprot:TRINITY_DN2115_c0_g1_i1.p1 TRINITY_DN2115_c0_g1~~TRINITY_DN2115_c0_g1_i1.p1  ORF type:complete len:571 (+),score=125.03 TRINITY_DN2115_c0_g1_i1:80-1714(+)